MPTETFLNLSEEKRARFIEVALMEFSEYNFEAASINRIIKKLGIARGSVYQYFSDKLDLWLYLKSYSEAQKIRYIKDVRRADFPDFWTYYEALYHHGIYFDLEQPLCSRFLYRLGSKETSSEVAAYLDDWKEKSRAMLRQWIEAEQQQGTISTEISADVATHFLMTMSLGIADLLRHHYAVDFEQNFQDGKPLFATNLEAYTKAVKDLIFLLKKALQ